MKEVEFRNGKMEVPDHLAVLMAKFQTHQMTYEEALRRLNLDMLSDHLRQAQGRIVSEHLSRYGIE
jgi:hypothetical protein